MSPAKPNLRDCPTTAAACAPPKTAIERGRSRRPRLRIRHPTLASRCPQKLARDDVSMDLAGAVPDALDARVAPDALQRQVVHQAHAAMDLDRLVGPEGQPLGGHQIGP